MNAKKKARKQRKKKNAAAVAVVSSDDDLKFLDEIIAENEQLSAEVIQINADFKLRCTYCMPTVGFEGLTQLKEHMMTKHLTSEMFAE